ncbi:exonuclease [Limnochorda pilosa]|uniref:Exonuclease n=1 Tax=Limnochorda pilosa TaxID=1555112 RepID=A0A0K2SGI3_LIMPI|nr:exonuclease [Limnochorda pilosa]
MAGVVDVETTGLSPRRDEIVELALILFAFDRATGHIQGVVDEYSGLREPSVPISAGASKVNGITWEMVRGRRLDEPRVEQMLRRAEFLVAHNAPFDRSFLTRLFPLAGEKLWACSMRSVDWRGLGFDSAALQSLLRHHGIMAERAHRGPEDAHATLALLSRVGPDNRPYFYWLLQSYRPQPSSPGLTRRRPRWTRPGHPEHSL